MIEYFRIFAGKKKKKILEVEGVVIVSIVTEDIYIQQMEG